jgi:alanine-alpha-ketoisovalerate/valine-pyruvate aminotransferase
MQLTTGAEVAVDTEVANGGTPQTVAATCFQIAAMATELYQNTATSTVHAATLNTKGGSILTEALTTAQSANYTFTLTNSNIGTATKLQSSWHSASNTGGVLNTISVTCAAGSAVLVASNIGTAALNGTMLLAFHI